MKIAAVISSLAITSLSLLSGFPVSAETESEPQTALTADEICAMYVPDSAADHGLAGKENGSFHGATNLTSHASGSLIIGRDGTSVWIQREYYQKAKDAVKACFADDGTYLCLDANGNPVPLIVPKDHCEEARQYLRELSESGKIKGAAAEIDAEKLVQESQLEFAQMKAVVDAGNIDVLSYDAEQQKIVSSSELDIGTVMIYAINRNYGASEEEALRFAAENALCSSDAGVLLNLVMNDLSAEKSSSKYKLADKTIHYIFDKVPDERIIAMGIRTAGNLIAKADIAYEAVLFISDALPDVNDWVHDRISYTQMVKNLLEKIGLGSLLNQFLPHSDADEIAQKIEEAFIKDCKVYLVTEQEGDNITQEIERTLADSPQYIQDIHQFRNEPNYVNILFLDRLFKEEVQNRKSVTAPTAEQMRAQLKELMNESAMIH